MLLCLAVMPAPALSEGMAANERVYYEIFPASFYDGNGDGMGDLAGIIEKIPYLSELGVGGIWLMPVHPSPSYHKYDVMNYYIIDPAYGTVDDLEALTAAAHEADMTLLMDLVVNHTSSQHSWFVSAGESLNLEPCGEEVCQSAPECRAHNPYVEYYHFTQEATPGWHAVPGAEGWYYMGHFSPDMPDLNLDSVAVRTELLSVCAYWLAKGVDGFRLDAVPHYYEESIPLNDAFLQWLMVSLESIKADVYVVGEVWKDAGSIAQYYESGISSLFNFPFSGADGTIVKAIREEKGALLAQKAAEWQAVWTAFEGASDAPFLGNHDQARIAGALMQDERKLKLAASLYLTLPGTPFLYYGEEIGMTGSGRDENKRLPMLWNTEDSPGYCLPPADADQTARVLGSVQAQQENGGSLWNHYRTLLALRKEHSALRNGTISVIETDQLALCAYRMANNEETIVVMHNLSEEAITHTLNGQEVTIPALGSLIMPVAESGA